MDKAICLYCGEDREIESDLPEIDRAMKESMKCDDCKAFGSVLIGNVANEKKQLYALDRQMFTRFYTALCRLLKTLADEKYPIYGIRGQISDLDDRINALIRLVHSEREMKNAYSQDDRYRDELAQSIQENRQCQDDLEEERRKLIGKEIDLKNLRRDCAFQYWMDYMEGTRWYTLGPGIISHVDEVGRGLIFDAHREHRRLCNDAREWGYSLPEENLVRYFQKNVKAVDREIVAHEGEHWKTVIVTAFSNRALVRIVTEALDQHAAEGQSLRKLLVKGSIERGTLHAIIIIGNTPGMEVTNTHNEYAAAFSSGTVPEPDPYDDIPF